MDAHKNPWLVGKVSGLLEFLSNLTSFSNINLKQTFSSCRKDYSSFVRTELHQFNSIFRLYHVELSSRLWLSCSDVLFLESS